MAEPVYILYRKSSAAATHVKITRKEEGTVNIQVFLGLLRAVPEIIICVGAARLLLSGGGCLPQSLSYG